MQGKQLVVICTNIYYHTDHPFSPGPGRMGHRETLTAITSQYGGALSWRAEIRSEHLTEQETEPEKPRLAIFNAKPMHYFSNHPAMPVNEREA